MKIKSLQKNYSRVFLWRVLSQINENKGIIKYENNKKEKWKELKPPTTHHPSTSSEQRFRKLPPSHDGDNLCDWGPLYSLSLSLTVSVLLFHGFCGVHGHVMSTGSWCPTLPYLLISCGSFGNWKKRKRNYKAWLVGHRCSPHSTAALLRPHQIPKLYCR